jgi:hypothetical protein
LIINFAAVLNNIEVSVILSKAMEHYRSWKSIGLELGIDGAALDAIEKKYRNDHRRLIAMVDLWHASVDLKPSQEAMTKALQSNRVTTSVVGVCLDAWESCIALIIIL